jgi:hypothetical protein
MNAVQSLQKVGWLAVLNRARKEIVGSGRALRLTKLVQSNQ